MFRGLAIVIAVNNTATNMRSLADECRFEPRDLALLPELSFKSSLAIDRLRSINAYRLPAPAILL